MPEYLLPCSCGEQTRVTVKQAGQSVQCVCGATLSVPNMRDLRLLEQSTTGTDRSERKWEDRHRVAFLLCLFAVIALGIGGWLYKGLPPSFQRPTADDVAKWLDEGTPREVMATWRRLEHGLQPAPPLPVDENRRLTLWGIGLAMAASGSCLLGAALVLATGSKSRKG